MVEKRAVLQGVLDRAIENYRPFNHLKHFKLSSYPTFLIGGGEGTTIKGGWKLAFNDMTVFAGAGFSFQVTSWESFFRPLATVNWA